MSDWLEKFIDEQRDDFDSEVPSGNVWERISDALEPEAKAPIAKVRILSLSWVRMAAAAVVILVSGVGIGLGLAGLGDQQPTIANPLMAELDEAEEYYLEQIQEKKAQLVRYQPDEALKSDLEQIDEALAEIRETLENTPPSQHEQLVSSLIETYQTKLDILERILMQIRDARRQQHLNQPNHGRNTEI